MKSKRLIVIEDGVILESMVTKFLCFLLDVPKTTARLFGETSAALPFHTKLEILLEIDYFDKTIKDKFTKFSEIRNKFAHLESVKNFTTCFDKIDGIVKKLQIWFPKIKKENFPDLETFYDALYRQLFVDVLSDVNRFTSFATTKTTNDRKLRVEARLYKCFADEIAAMAENDPELDKKVMAAWYSASEKAKEMPDYPTSRYLSDLE